MIRRFKHRGLKPLYERGDRSGIRPDLLETVERILTVLENAATPAKRRLPRLFFQNSYAPETFPSRASPLAQG